MLLSLKPNVCRYLQILVLLILIPAASYAKINKCDYFGWIKYQKVNVNDTIPAGEIQDGAYYLIIDRQINEFTQQVYYHYAYKIVSEQGVQNYSEINLNYNPAYQKFYLHNIRIIRNGVVLNNDATTHIKEIQQEKDLEDHIYDETKTIYAVLKDVRPNDIIEYDYTIEGFNPIFKNKIYLKFTPCLEYTLPHFYYRLLKPNNAVKYKYYNDAPLPQVIRSPNQEEWIWDYKNNKPIEPEDYAPYWYTAYPYVEISGFSSWKEVEQWGIDVFTNNEKLDDGLIKEINSIKTKYPGTKDQVIAAVRFVQKQIRYLGIEIGINSHKPKSPNRVYQQRYGDCKDKSLLLCKMLEKLGVEAYPALVNTWLSSEIKNTVPSAMIFNHAVVKANVDGHEYWFDPTLSTQEGDLSHNEFPNYEYSLVLDGKIYGLEGIASYSNSKVDIKEKIIVEDFIGNAVLQITTTYHGSKADDIRYSFAQNTLKEIQKNYLEFYKKNYDSITVEKSLHFNDDTVQDVLITHESYKIKDFWKKGKDIIQSQVYSYSINEKLTYYSGITVKRKAPLDLEFPLNIHHSFEVIFPENWSLTPFDEVINNNHFHFSAKGSCIGNTCYVDYNYRTFNNSVPANEVEAFIKDVKRIEDDHNGLLFSYNASMVKSSFGVGLFMLFILFIVALVILFVWLYFKREPAVTYDIFHPKIGGWMVLPILGLIVTPIINLFSLIKGNYFDLGTFNLYTTPSSSSYDVLWGPYWIFGIFIHAAFVVFPVLILIMVFKYDRRSPSYFIYYYVFNLASNIIVFILARSIENIDTALESASMKDFMRAFIHGAIWMPYFYYSARVKETFVE